jgi:hypothetical protein
VKYFFLTLIFLIHLSPVFSQSNYWQQQANYNISVQLNDNDNSLDAFEKIEYINNSPDTLYFIWFHLWPNAYKNDRTEFSEQLLRNGRMDFYFSNDTARGYINRLNFQIENENIKTETHPKYIDVVKLILSKPLLPKHSITITTPFHVKLPNYFSRSGHTLQSYQITQWYPKPAVYDKYGWHPIPYLDQGEFYSEFGNYDIEITVPEKYIVAATGELQDKDELEKLKHFKIKDSSIKKQEIKPKTSVANSKKQATNNKLKTPERKKQVNPSFSVVQSFKTLHYIQNNVHDFAWFADKNFIVEYDTLKLPTKTVDVFSFYYSINAKDWKSSIAYAKDGLKFYSKNLGDYPYNIASVVCNNTGESGGMEYPTITLITNGGNGFDLDAVIAHELGHNWFYGALASNERDHAWMDEGMNTFYESKYEKEKYGYTDLSQLSKEVFYKNRLPEDFESLLVKSIERIHKDQAIETTSDSISSFNYSLMVYLKGSKWLEQVEKYVGKESFAKAMQQYYKQWQGKHPYPVNFKKSIETSTGKNIDSIYQFLFTTSKSFYPAPQKKQLKPAFIFSSKNTDKYNYISALPMVGINHYDGFMFGAMIHNYQLPLNKFQFFAIPMYAFGSNTFNVFGRASYNIYKRKYWLEFSSSVSKFSYDNFVTDNNDKISQTVVKFVPSAKLILYNKDLRSTERWKFQLRSFLLKEDNLQFNTVTTPTDTFDVVNKYPVNSYINQLQITWSNNRVLYPFEHNLTIDQGKDFIRAGFTSNYFFNYTSGKQGIQARFFAGKFFYLSSKTFLAQANTDRYHLNMSGPKGNEDYTYSNYFLGRSEFEGWMSQQITERDGFFKVRTDYLSDKAGKTDNWLMAMNFSGDIPDKINPLNLLPIKIKMKFFVDVGTYAEAWQDNAGTGRFLYDAGLQFPLFKSLVNIYVPIFYSKVYKDYNKSILGENAFLKTISFNIDLKKFQLNKLIRDIPL